jgi:hypothetical protein
MNTTWGTFTRRHGVKWDVCAVRCANHSEWDEIGFAVQGPNDPAGDRCTAPIVGAPCEVCGKDT